MLYAIHDDDGRIYQANRVYIGDDEHKAYQSLLNDLGHKYVQGNNPSIPMTEEWFVKGGELSERPDMNVTLNKTLFKCGPNDAAVIKGIIKGSRFEVRAAGVTIWSGKLDGEELEIHSPVPCQYTIVLNYWPYKQLSIIVEAIA